MFANGQTFFQVGITAKLEMNALQTMGTDGRDVRQFEKSPGGAYGLAVAQSLGKRLFGELSFLSTRAVYNPNISVGNTSMQKADLRLFQTNATINAWLSNGNFARIYAFGGLQHMYRRWGEEYYTNAALQDSRWPNHRLQVTAGLGVGVKCTQNIYARIFSGLRYNPVQTLIYDTPMNQVFTGISVFWQWEKSAKPAYYKCPQF